MKKIKILLISLFIIIFISGCGNTDNKKSNTTTSDTKVLKCTNVNDGTNMKAYSNVEYYFTDDKLKSSYIEVDFKDITVDNLSAVWDTFKKQFTEQNKPTNEDGFVREVKADDDNYIFTVTIKVDFDKITDEVMQKYSVKNYANYSYDKILQEAIKDGKTTCK